LAYRDGLLWQGFYTSPERGNEQGRTAMMSYLMAVSDELQMVERRARLAEAERIRRKREALALAGYVSTADRARSCVARLLVRLATALDTRSGEAPRAAAQQA
jgi:hypothetical protein